MTKINSKDVSTLDIFAIVNHEKKEICIIADGEKNTVSFSEYDEWGSFNIGKYTFDWHLQFDQELTLSVYGLEYIKHNGKEVLQTNVDTCAPVTLVEIGKTPDDIDDDYVEKYYENINTVFFENTDSQYHYAQYKRSLPNGYQLLLQKEDQNDEYFIATLYDEEYEEIADFFEQEKNIYALINKLNLSLIHI